MLASTYPPLTVSLMYNLVDLVKSLLIPFIFVPALHLAILIFLGSFLLSVHNKNVVAALSLSSSTIKLTPVIKLSFFLFNASV